MAPTISKSHSRAGGSHNLTRLVNRMNSLALRLEKAPLIDTETCRKNAIIWKSLHARIHAYYQF